MDTYTQRASVSSTYSITVLGFLCLAIAISSLFYYTPASSISIQDCSVSKVVDLKKLRISQNDKANLELSVDVNLEPLWNWNVKQLFVYIVAEFDQDVTEEEIQSALRYKQQYKKDFEKRKKEYLKKQRRKQMQLEGDDYDEEEEEEEEGQQQHQEEEEEEQSFHRSLTKSHTRNTSLVLWDQIIVRGDNSHLKFDNLLNEYALVDIGNHLRNQKLKLSLRWHVTPYLGFMYFGQATKTFSFTMPNKYLNNYNTPQQNNPNYPYDLDDLVYA